ncbi:MAG: SMI1/KNR4 family protein [Janthinobacterium lividum]
MTYTTFRHLVIEDARVPVDVDEIAAIEAELGAVLPSSFLDFLNAASGGTVEYSVRIPPTSEGDEMMFCDIFHAGRDRQGEHGDGTLVGEIRGHRRFLGLPPGVLPFARDGGDSTVYLDLTKEGAGRVIAWVHGMPAWTGHRLDDGWVTVASNFDEYVSLLQLDEADAVSLLEEALKRNNPQQTDASRQFLDLALTGWRDRYPNLAGTGGIETDGEDHTCRP